MSPEGYEVMFAVNHLGTFLFTLLLAERTEMFVWFLVPGLLLLLLEVLLGQTVLRRFP